MSAAKSRFPAHARGCAIVARIRRGKSPRTLFAIVRITFTVAVEEIRVPMPRAVLAGQVIPGLFGLVKTQKRLESAMLTQHAQRLFTDDGGAGFS